jgi:hypothetical protein
MQTYLPQAILCSMLTRQEQLFKFCLPSRQRKLNTIKDQIVSMDPDALRCQNHDFHEASILKMTSPFLNHFNDRGRAKSQVM